MHIAVSQYGYWGSQVDLGVLLPCYVAFSEILENGILFELKVKRKTKTQMNLQRFRKTCQGQLQTLKTSKSTSPGVQQEPGEAQHVQHLTKVTDGL